MKSLRCVFIGKSGVGKTTILRLANNNRHPPLPTIGIDNVLFDYKDTFVQAWDTSGADQFKSVSKLFIEKSRLCVYVYDASNPNTYESDDIPPNAMVVANVTRRGSVPLARDHIPVNISNPETIHDLLDAMIMYAVFEDTTVYSKTKRTECCCCF